MPYTAPLDDLLFGLEHLAGLPGLARLPGLEEAGLDTARAVLEECARFAAGVLDPLNRTGDLQPARLDGDAVRTSPGFREAFQQYAQGGWQGLQHPPEFGGQGLPKAIATACGEMLNAANMSFALAPLLTDGAIEALLTAGSEAQRATYLPPMLEGRWTGTMNLTEPQAGSDLALVRTRAEPLPDGRHALRGTKIFITYGEHDLAENIVHLVLARLAGAPEGVKGISLFVVPKFLVNADGSLGARNDVRCVSLEHKLGIHASPTAVLQFGDEGGAIGELVGLPNRGLELMFVMMNAARFAVGVQGVAISERALQQATAYARERVQSRPVDGSAPGSATIVHHPDVRRMLMTMRAATEGGRALALAAAAMLDRARHEADEGERALQQALHEFLVPIVKGYATEMAQEVASLGVQVHGGMGYIEETGAAQHFRDARILTIYEGTTAIQANDLVGRKTVRDGGATAHRFAGLVAATEQAAAARESAAAQSCARHLATARSAFEEVVAFIRVEAPRRPALAYAGSVPFLMLAGHLASGWQMTRALLAAEAALAAGPGPHAFLHAKIATARFHAEHLLTRAGGLRDAVIDGGESVLALPPEAF